MRTENLKVESINVPSYDRLDKMQQEWIDAHPGVHIKNTAMFAYLDSIIVVYHYRLDKPKDKS